MNKQIEEMARGMCLDCAKYSYCSLAQVGGMCNSVRKQATVLYEAGYRKQSEGEWMVKNAFFAIYKCSICGEENLYKDGHACLSEFCPNCGAKMKGGE